MFVVTWLSHGWAVWPIRLADELACSIERLKGRVVLGLGDRSVDEVNRILSVW